MQFNHQDVLQSPRLQTENISDNYEGEQQRHVNTCALGQDVQTALRVNENRNKGAIIQDHAEDIKSLEIRFKQAVHDERNAYADRIGLNHWELDGQTQRFVREMDKIREQISCLQEELNVKELELEILKKREKLEEAALRRELYDKVTAIMKEKERELEKLVQPTKNAQAYL